MSNLSPELEKLVLASKDASRPASTDFERVQRALSSKLNITFPVYPTPAAGTIKGLWSTWMGKSLVLATLGAVLMVMGSEQQLLSVSYKSNSTSADIPVIAPLQVGSANPTVAQSDLPAALPVIVSPTSESRQPPRVSPSALKESKGDSLAEEVILLSKAERALNRGQPSVALNLLSTHERRFPTGVLTEERVAAFAQAYCALGRLEEANKYLARLAPDSIHNRNARKYCDAVRKNGSAVN